MKIIFFGATKFSEELLDHLLENNIKPICLFTIPEEFSISYSETKVKNYNYSDINKIAVRNNIPCYYIDSSEHEKITNDYFELINKLKPDLILILGWYYFVPKKIRDIAPHGAWGIHASLLPSYAGGAPLVWAMINGEKETGVTLFKLDDGIDDGDIIAQNKIVIEFHDTIKEVYDKVILDSKKILLNAIINIDNIKFKKQNKDQLTIYPQRKPDDGEIDFERSSMEIYNFIRAQSFPYPGAFFRTVDGKKIIIEKAKIQDS